jgi:hypothetical protein
MIVRRVSLQYTMSLLIALLAIAAHWTCLAQEPAPKPASPKVRRLPMPDSVRQEGLRKVAKARANFEKAKNLMEEREKRRGALHRKLRAGETTPADANTESTAIATLSNEVDRLLAENDKIFRELDLILEKYDDWAAPKSTAGKKPAGKAVVKAVGKESRP